ncbi:MAG: hypothetical protein OWU33_16060 [Firmicutes bacterium]|nr:hypothetical protein [Bacillota bacterium]
MGDKWSVVQSRDRREMANHVMAILCVGVTGLKPHRGSTVELFSLREWFSDVAGRKVSLFDIARVFCRDAAAV